MGAFDHFKLLFPIPELPIGSYGWQTQSPESPFGELWELRADGTLWERRQQYETSMDLAKPLGVLLHVIKSEWVKSDWDGQFVVYTEHWELLLWLRNGYLGDYILRPIPVLSTDPILIEAVSAETTWSAVTTRSPLPTGNAFIEVETVLGQRIISRAYMLRESNASRWRQVILPNLPAGFRWLDDHEIVASGDERFSFERQTWLKVAIVVGYPAYDCVGPVRRRVTTG